MMHFIWTIIIGFVAGLIARAVTPGDKGPQGFILNGGPWNHWRARGNLPRAGHWLVWVGSECRLYRRYRRRSAHTVGLGIY